MRITRGGTQPSEGARPTGSRAPCASTRRSSASAARAAGNAVTFEPGARTAWHTHPPGQTPIVTAVVHGESIEVTSQP